MAGGFLGEKCGDSRVEAYKFFSDSTLLNALGLLPYHLRAGH
jgi:hypothetical protein